VVPPAFHRLGWCRWNGCGEPLVGAGGVGLHAGQDVLVGLDGEGDVGVAESLTDDLDGDAFLDEQAPVGVAQVVLMPTSA
jgi:hypothetical protein